MTGSTPQVDDVETDDAAVSVENVGGIDHFEVAFEPGVTVLAGRNATNRTSLLSAIGGVLGGSSASLKSDADAGEVILELGGETYEVAFDRTAAGVRVDGSPYSADGEYVDLFVSLLEDNPARRAVERGEDLRDVIMRPVDTDAIDAFVKAHYRHAPEDVTAGGSFHDKWLGR